MITLEYHCPYEENQLPGLTEKPTQYDYTVDLTEEEYAKYMALYVQINEWRDLLACRVQLAKKKRRRPKNPVGLEYIHGCKYPALVSPIFPEDILEDE